MPIRRKDGSTYRLRGPNPLMLQQEHWDLSQLTLYNFSRLGTKTTIVDPSRHVLVLPRPTPPPEPIPEPPRLPDTPPNPPRPGTVKVHCLPGERQSHWDDLYDERHTRVVYGKSFEFEAVVRDMTDMSVILWTANRGVTPGSVVYPQTGHRRWWLVQDTEDAGGGVEMTCIPSEVQPSF